MTMKQRTGKRVVHRMPVRSWATAARSLGGVFKKVASSSKKKGAKRLFTGQAFRMKRRGRSHTKTNNNEENQLEISQHNDLSMHSLRRLDLGGKGSFVKVDRSYFSEDYQTIHTGAQGIQSSTMLEIVNNRNKMLGLTSSARNQNYTSAFNPWQLNLGATDTTNTFFSASSAYPNSGNTIGVNYTEWEFNFLSMETVPQIVELYFSTPVNDISYNPIESWTNSLVTERFGVAPVAGPTAIADPNGQVGGAMENNVGQKPTDCKGFNKLWKTLYKRTFVLQPGDQRNFKGRLYTRRFALRQTIVDRNREYLRGFTVVPWITIKAGMVGIVATDISDVASEVAFGGTKIGVICKYKHVYGFPKAPMLTPKVQEVDLLYNQTLTKQKMVDDTDELDILKQV